MPERSKRKTKEGVVFSNKMDKTVVVAVERLYKHPLYNKTIKRIEKFSAHDEGNKCKVGDKVTMVETRPISKNKRWRIEEITGHKEILKGTENDTSTDQA